MFCKHKWKVMVNERKSAPINLLPKHTLDNLKRASDWMFKEGIVMVMVCEKCGKIDKTENNI